MLHRGLDATFPEEVRRRITLLTLARTASNGCFRFAPPFLATIASGLDVSLDTIGVAVAVSELSGLATPLTGRFAERLHRRTAMSAGLAGVGAASALAAASTSVAVLAIALVLLSQTKVLFDLGLGAWVSDRVPYERRGRVIGITEMSWALGLLLGVSTMGLLTALTNWRVGYAAGAVAVVVMAALVRRYVAADPPAGHEHARPAQPASLRLEPAGWALLGGALCLMASSQMLFVTFGSWLKDGGFSDGQVAVLAFALGFGELFASFSASRVSDHWGKERSGAIGALVMTPATTVLALGSGSLAVGLVGLVVAIGAFEFAIVCVLPLGTRLVEGAPAFGMSLLLAAGTCGRALASVPATRLYTRHGMAWPAALAAVLAVLTAVAMWRLAALRRR